MKDILVCSIELINVATTDCNEREYSKDNNFCEYKLPRNPMNLKEEMEAIVNKEQPDIIHIWGVEQRWAELLSNIKWGKPILLEIQGLRQTLLPVYNGGLSSITLLPLIRISEIKHPFSFPTIQKRFVYKEAEKEREIIGKYYDIGCPSRWIEDWLKADMGKGYHYYRSLIPLRKEFYNSRKWENHEERRSPVLFFSTSYFAAFKGFHVLLEALSLLKREYPEIKLRVAGPVFYKHENNVYERYLSRYIRSNNLENNIVFAGRKDANGLIEELLTSDIFINPSFVESYSVSTAEALYLGVPSLLAYTGAMPEFSKDTQAAHYYSCNDYITLAAKVRELFEDTSLCNNMSVHSIAYMEKKCAIETIAQTQMSIYNEVINNYKGEENG